MKVIVTYSDGSEQTVVEKDEFEVAARIEETVKGLNFQIMPTKVVGENGDLWGFNWSFRLEQPFTEAKPSYKPRRDAYQLGDLGKGWIPPD